MAIQRMRRLVVCLLLVFFPTLARASGVHLLIEPGRLSAPWLPEPPSAPLVLAEPCLACHPFALAEPSVALVVQLVQAPAAPRLRSARRAQPVPSRGRVLAIGDSWGLGHGRELSIRLTPTQEECAPLVRLTF